jgi:hypothetical protein
MPKKPVSKKPKMALVKPSPNSNIKVLSLIDKLERKTEKQLAGFVKEIVKLKKSQIKLAEKLDQSKKISPTKVKKAKSTLEKKRKPLKLKLVDNAASKSPPSRQ